MVKADIMNTAGQDLFLGKDHTGPTFAPNRVGSGRIKADAALANRVVLEALSGMAARRHGLSHDPSGPLLRDR